MVQSSNNNKFISPRLLAYIGLILTTLFWAGNAVVARGMAGIIPPVALSFWRWFIALIILLPFCWSSLRSKRQIIGQHFGILVLFGALSVGFFNTLLYLAAQTTSAANIGLINSNMPIMVFLLGWLLLGEKPGPVRIIGIVFALFGMLIIVGQGNLASFVSLDFHTGDLLMVLAIAFWSIFSVLLKRHPIPLSALEFLAVQIFFGVLVILPFYAAELLLAGGFTMQAPLILPFLYVAIFPGLLAYGLWNYGVQQLGSSSAAMSAYLIPLFSAALAWIFLGEQLAAYHGLGGLLIMLGVYMVTRN
jgi:drug/metabolite transporter (DMT)-like permease